MLVMEDSALAGNSTRASGAEGGAFSRLGESTGAVLEGWPEHQGPKNLQMQSSAAGPCFLTSGAKCPPPHLLPLFPGLPLQPFQEDHSLLTALRPLLPHPGLDLPRQHGQELLQHQQLQDLLLGAQLRPQPAAAELPERLRASRGPATFW